MNAAAWLIVLAISAANDEAAEPVRIAVVESSSNRLVGYAQVAIYAPGGQCIRRGQTGLFGEPLEAEATAPLNPAYRQLRVMAEKVQGGRVAQGSTIIVYDGKTWKPQTSDLQSTKSQTTGPQITFTAQRQPLGPGPNVPGPTTMSWIEVAIPVEPIPVCRTPPWQFYAGGCRCGGCAPVAAGEVRPPCLPIAPLGQGVTLLPRTLPPTANAPAADPLAARDAALVDAGRPATPQLPWARFGDRWVAGPSGMYWIAPAIPRQPAPQPNRAQAF
jgi:hypothetical protein